jgi:hypothetical protein
MNIKLLVSAIAFMACLNAINSYANNETSSPNTKISVYVDSQSYSNILPVKQLIEDDWKQAPSDDSSTGFTQNEAGIKVNWKGFYFNIAQRLDYFVYTNNDTAQAFYLERTDQPLTQESYQASLSLHHQRSNGLRLGYQWFFDDFSIGANLGYWQVSASRESQITGEIFGDGNNNINGKANISEFYSNRNFLKRGNSNDWDIDGNGYTLDMKMHWKMTTDIDIDVDLKDLYTKFKMKNLGYSEGVVDTNGTFINSLGGISYLPLYSGKETESDFEFTIPKRINVEARYSGFNNKEDTNSLSINYLTRYKRQADSDFYYGGVEFVYKESMLKVLLDVVHLAPEIQYTNQWFNFILSIDDIDTDKAMQFDLGLSFSYSF